MDQSCRVHKREKYEEVKKKGAENRNMRENWRIENKCEENKVD